MPGQAAGSEPVTIPVNLCNLPPFHSVANLVLALSGDPEVDLKELAAVMEEDPAFAAEILLLANSALFGFPSRMHDLAHAVTILGLDRIRALAVTVAMRSFVENGGALIHRSWRHSAACAIISETIAPALRVPKERGYTGGIMHDIGRLGLLKTYALEYGAVLCAPYTGTEQLLDAERAAVGIDHGLAGAWLVRHWAFPQPFVEICEHHHGPLKPIGTRLLQSVKLACRMADTLGYAAVEFRRPTKYRDLLASHPYQLSPAAFPAEEKFAAILEQRLSVFEP